MASTAGTLSEALIASMAAGLLDEYHITSLDDDTDLGRFMAREFGTVRREVLESYPWRRARKRAVLTESGSAPAFGWEAQYQLPSDCLRIWRLSRDGEFNGTPIPHEIEGSMLLCDVESELYVIYIFDQTAVGTWTALMGRVLACKLAMYAAQRVTGKASYVEKTANAYRAAMYEATHADALAQGSAENTYDSGFLGLDSMTSRGVYR